LNVPQGIALDGRRKNAYVTSNGSGALAIFSRDKATGVLTQPAGIAGCLNETGAEGCGIASPLANAHQVLVAANGKSLSLTTDAGVTTFQRNKSTGVLTELAPPAGCISDTGSGGACAVGTGLDGASGIVMTSSRKRLYVAGSAEDAIVALTLS